MAEIARLIGADVATLSIAGTSFLGLFSGVTIELSKPITPVTAIKDTDGAKLRYTHTATYNEGTFRAEKLILASSMFPELLSSTPPLTVTFKESATGKTHTGNIFIERYRRNVGNEAQLEEIEGQIDSGWTIT